MFKKLVFLSRLPSLDQTAFAAHWSGPHADIIRSIIRHFPNPETVRYTQNRVSETLWEYASDQSRALSVDGIVELHVPSPRPTAAANESGAVARMIEDEGRFLRGLTECLVVPRGADAEIKCKKVMVAVTLRASAPGDESDPLVELTGLLDDLAPRQVCINVVEAVVRRDRLWSEPVIPDVVAELWFDDAAEDAISRLRSGCLQKPTKRASIYMIDALQILPPGRS